MRIIDNTSLLLGDDLKATVGCGARLKIAAFCFSIYAFEALKVELSKLESLQFIFTAPTFVPMEVTDRLRKERREFFIPAMKRERGLDGTVFEIQLRNKLTQRAVARECADWIKKKARFRSNTTKAPMQQFIHLSRFCRVDQRFAGRFYVGTRFAGARYDRKIATHGQRGAT